MTTEQSERFMCGHCGGAHKWCDSPGALVTRATGCPVYDNGQSEPISAERVVIGKAELWCGDCRDVLPKLPVFDMILTDPPFGMGNFVQTTGRLRGRGSGIGKAVWWNDNPPGADVFALIRAKSKHRVIWGANFFNCFEPDGGAIVWIKKQSMPNFSKADIASCTHFKKTETVEIPWTNFTVAHQAETDHPCERPVRLYEWCIAYMPKGESVCDPYAGSGSVGVAAVRMGRSFVGIERERRYFDAACERIERAQRQCDLLAGELENHRIEAQ